MRKYILALLAATLAFAPLLARAEGPSYSFVEAGYIFTDIDDFDEEFDGFGIRGSFEFVENWFLYAGYLDQSAEIFGVDVDATGFDVGIGYAFPTLSTTTAMSSAWGSVPKPWNSWSSRVQ
jgi:hypothetical protein